MTGDLSISRCEMDRVIDYVRCRSCDADPGEECMIPGTDPDDRALVHAVRVVDYREAVQADER